MSTLIPLERAGAFLAQLRAQRLELTRRSLPAFAAYYLAHHVRCEPSSMHRELYELLEGMALRGRGTHLAVAAPRGHAKSTLVSLVYVLWCVCFQLERFIVLISDASAQANDLLGHIKRELEDNPRIRADFPLACQLPGAKPAPESWRQDVIITASGVRVAAFGAGKKIRGRRHGQHRPSLIVLDDVENEVQVASPEQRDKLAAWLAKAVLKAGDGDTNVVAVGTILHYDSLLARLTSDDPTRSPGWKKKVYRAVQSFATRGELWDRFEAIYTQQEVIKGATGPEAARAYYAANEQAMLEGVSVLWPQKEGYLELMELWLRDGRASFDSEKQNDPIDPAECLFRESDLIFWEDEFGSEERLLAYLKPRGVRMFGACDPSMGKLGRNRDDSAIVTLAQDPTTKLLYVLDADISRRKPDRILEDIFAYHQRRHYRKFAVESVQYQEFLADQLVARFRTAGLSVPVEKLTPTGDKLGRIQSLQPRVHSGQLRFSKRHRRLLDQLRRFPKGAHDDGPDALEMAVRAVTAPVHYVVSQSIW